MIRPLMNKLGMFLLVAILIGCAGKKPEDFQEEKELFAHANRLFEDKSYSDAIPFFESLRNRFPRSPLAIEADLKIADAYFNRGDYMEAELNYQSFRSLYPTHEKIPYVVFRMAKSHYEQIPGGVDRDQMHTENARKAFQEVIQRWPNSPEAKDSLPFLEKCERALKKRELYVIDFYLKRKKYRAARLRLEPMKNDERFPDLQMEVQYRLGVSLFHLKEEKDAREMLRKTLDSSLAPEKYKNKAKNLLLKLDARETS